VVFRDAQERKRLEEIVHPTVERLRQEELRRAAAAGLSLVISDIPLLFEAGLEDDFDLIVLVDAPEELRLERLIELRRLEPDEAQRMIAAQWPSEAKRARADIVIDNDGPLPELKRRAAEVLADLVERAAGGRE
jgi:dephospho-CoA kinase